MLADVSRTTATALSRARNCSVDNAGCHSKISKTLSIAPCRSANVASLKMPSDSRRCATLNPNATVPRTQSATSSPTDQPLAKNNVPLSNVVRE